MNYERFKKVIVSMALIFVFVFSTIVTSVTPVSAQWYYYPRRYVWGQQYYRPVYRYPYQYPGQYYRYQYRIYNPYYGYPSYQYQYYYPYGYSRYGWYRWNY